jgi:two-component system, NarL family, sensor kinase
VAVGIEGRVDRRRVVVLAWSLWALTVLAMAGVLWLYHLGRQVGGGLDASIVVVVLAAVSAATVGAVVASRRPNHPVGWLLLGFGLSVNALGVAQPYAEYGHRVGPHALPAARYVGLGFPALVVTALALLGFVLLLTPTGSLPSPRWRWWARTTAAAPVVSLVTILLAARPFDQPYEASHPNQTIEGPLALTAGVVLPVGFQLAFAVANLAVVVGTASLVVRFRRARGRQRQQLRWVALAAVLVALGSVVAMVGTVVALPQNAILSSPVFLGMAAGIYLLPLAISAAILRYRLYDLDYLISRTVMYGLLTAGGVAVYVGVVKSAEWLLREGARTGGSLLATAVIAAGFAPARDRLQRVFDRRLYGERHDPVRAMARLGARLRDAPGGAPSEDVLAGVLQAVCEALRLPSASLRVEDGVEVATFGQPGTASESIPLEHEGQRIGALLVGVRSGEDALGAADRQVLEVLAAPVAVALHAVLLSQELQRSRERLVAAREEERRRLRRDLHDGLGPILTAVTLKADAARSALGSAPDRADGLLAELRGDANQAIGDLRRVIYDLRPAALDELGLLGALNQQVDRFSRQGLSITLHAPPTLPVLPAAVEVAAYRILTEALTNVARHADAHQVTITIAIDGDLCLEVNDDGATRTAHGGGWRPGVGLMSMAERVAEVGGTLEVGPTPTGGRVQASLPLALP